MYIQNGVWVIISRDKGKTFTFFKSLRVRITVILFFIGMVPCVIATNVVVRSYENRAISLREISVKNQCDILCDSLVSEQYLGNPYSDVLNSQISLVSTFYSGRVMIVNEDFKVIRDTYDIDSGRTSVSKEVVNAFDTGKGSTQYDGRNRYILMTFPIKSRSGDSVEGVMIISISTNDIAQNAESLENRGLMVTASVCLAVLLLGYFLAGVLVSPFLKITDAIEDVSDGFTEEAVSVPDYTETELITTAFNRMLARVRRMDASRQEFVSNVSHELKTPLASMKVLADSINGQDNVPIEIYREFMSDITQEIDRENEIITDLLSLVRLDRKAAKMNFELTDIESLLTDNIKRLKPIADRQKILLSLTSDSPVEAEVDTSKISLAFSNLIENGIKYNKPEGLVKVFLTQDKRYFYVTVTDSGMGIPEDQLDHIFERFYRVEKSHSSEIEGTGLGLAITKSVILLHHGAIKVTSKVGEGSTFHVRLPLRHD
ncbi:MAG: HAMP domain-containing histidine kinase [Lachnospiraceae bacterium]|nr:HAMP domain-containing histidine kinase [Lachnospiraceae bacterium]